METGCRKRRIVDEIRQIKTKFNITPEEWPRILEEVQRKENAADLVILDPDKIRTAVEGQLIQYIQTF